MLLLQQVSVFSGEELEQLLAEFATRGEEARTLTGAAIVFNTAAIARRNDLLEHFSISMHHNRWRRSSWRIRSA